MQALTTIEEARAQYQELYREWWVQWKLGLARPEYLVVKEAMGSLVDAAVAKFGKPNPRHPECVQCLRNSVFGGPDHEPSRECESGRRPHCACDTCF